jgi:RNA polymerase sigma-70 factor (ECF subfamily)
MTSDEFAEAYQQYAQRLVGLVYSRLPDSHKSVMLAEDISQDAWLRAYREIASYQEHGSFWNWIARIAINHMLDGIRLRDRLCYLSEVDPYDRIALIDDPEARAVCAASAASLDSAIDRLAPRSALVIHAQFGEGWQPRQIAVATGWSVGTVKLLRHRGLNTLRRSITQGRG